MKNKGQTLSELLMKPTQRLNVYPILLKVCCGSAVWWWCWRCWRCWRCWWWWRGGGAVVAWWWRGGGVVVAWWWRGAGVVLAWWWRGDGVVMAWWWRGGGVLVARWLGGGLAVAWRCGVLVYCITSNLYFRKSSSLHLQIMWTLKISPLQFKNWKM
jgi:hypothetical protein